MSAAHRAIEVANEAFVDLFIFFCFVKEVKVLPRFCKASESVSSCTWDMPEGAAAHPLERRCILLELKERWWMALCCGVQMAFRKKIVI